MGKGKSRSVTISGRPVHGREKAEAKERHNDRGMEGESSSTRHREGEHATQNAVAKSAKNLLFDPLDPMSRTEPSKPRAKDWGLVGPIRPRITQSTGVVETCVIFGPRDLDIRNGSF